MNRRELFNGLAAAFVAAQIPIPIAAIEALPDSQAIAYLRRVRLDFIDKIISPPCILHEDNTLEIMPTKPWDECLVVVNNLIEELNV
jgi:hypothetical protein